MISFLIESNEEVGEVQLKKIFVRFFDNVPSSVLNFLTIVSAIITIIMPIIGGIGLKNLYPDENGIFLIFVVTVVVLVVMQLIVLRYMIKYKKLLMGTRKVTTSKFFQFTRNFRNSIFTILNYKLTEKLTVELLTEKTEAFLQIALDEICDIYKEFTHQEVFACIKYIDQVGNIDRDTATIKTFARSSNTDSERCENDNNNEKPVYVKDNTDFYSILSPNSPNKKSYFYQGNLVKYAENKDNNYNNSTRNWQEYYKSTIVVPISIANKRLYTSNIKHCYNVIGFLCMDSLSTDAFLEREERYNIDLAQAFAAEFYVFLSQYKDYLKELTIPQKE